MMWQPFTYLAFNVPPPAPAPAPEKKERPKKKRRLRAWLVRIGLLTLVLGLAPSCSISQYLPEDEYLYLGSSVNIEAPDGTPTGELQLEVNRTLNDNVNAKTPLLGYYGIWKWYRWQEKAAKNPEKYADKDPKGSEPIFYDEKLAESVGNLIENRAANNGYFQHDLEFALDTLQDPRAVKVDYLLEVGHDYRIDTVETFWSDADVGRIVDSTMRAGTLLKPGVRYDLNLVKAERKRWEEALRAAGYYFASGNDFIFLADTVQGNHQVKLLAKIKDDIPPNHLTPQEIVDINVYPNVDPRDTLRQFQNAAVRVGGIDVICDDCPLRPEILDEGFDQEIGRLYSPTSHNKTLRRLANYNTFRYISMSYDPVPGSDSTLVLNAYLQPRLRRRIEAEFGLTYNNARYFGPNLSLTYLNRNLLRGAELLRLEGDFSYAISSGEDVRVPRSGIYGLQATLEVPRLWLPKRRKLIPRVFTSGTVISLGGKLETLDMNLQLFDSEIQSNQLNDLAALVELDKEATETVSLLQLSGKFGYTWRRRIAKSHAFYPLSVRFQDPQVSSPQLLDLARQLGVAPGTDNGASRFDRMLVFSPTYTLTYDDRKKGLKTHNIFWQQTIALSVNNVFPVGTRIREAEAEQSIYPQLETDLRYYLTLSNRQQFAVRFHGGAAVPFTDRAIVPYFDLYTIGGPNSLRGFSPRELGPGRTAPVAGGGNLLSFGGYGNLILEASVEFRQRINSLIEVAPFFDAGNIWTYKTELEPLDTDFRQNTFLNELAMDAGLGFRFDLQFLILRIDLAKPLRIPYEDTLPSQEIPFAAAGQAPDKNIRFVLAFGYPF